MALIGLLRIQDNEPAITNRQIWLLLTLGLACGLTGASQSFVPALFPLLALSKTQKMWQISMAFAAFQLGRIFVGRFERKVMAVVTPKFLVVTGVFLCGGTNILFGCMQWSPGSGSFVALNVFLQLINGVGMAMTFYAVILLVGGGSFYANAIYFIAAMDSCGIAGLVVGAPLATILYSLSNYFTTFAILGLILVVVAIALMAVVEEHNEELMEWPSKDDFSIYSQFSFIWVTVLVIAINSAVDSYIFITLSSELEQRKLNTIAIGCVFLVTYVFTCLGDFISAAVVLKTRCNFLVISFGSSLLAAGLACLGPASLKVMTGTPDSWGLNKQMGTIALGLILKGLGTGCVSSSAVAWLLRSARQQFPDDLITFIMVLKIVFTSEYVGHLIGSVCTGPLYEMVGHRDTTTFIACFFSLVILTFIVVHFLERRRRSYVMIEDTPLCGCSLNHRESHANGERPAMGLSSSIEPADSNEWNWLYGNNRTVL